MFKNAITHESFLNSCQFSFFSPFGGQFFPWKSHLQSATFFSIKQLTLNLPDFRVFVLSCFRDYVGIPPRLPPRPKNPHSQIFVGYVKRINMIVGNKKMQRRLTHSLNSRSHASSRSKGSGNLSIPSKPRPQNLPLWAPDGVDLEVVPPKIQQAVSELIQPIYEQFVINASDGLEKSLGITITHLLWLEILEQFDIKREYVQVEAVLNISHNRPEMIDRHLRLIDSKLRIGYFLVRIKELRSRLADQAQLQPQLFTDPPPAAASAVLRQLPNSENPPPQP
jgi:hypothetical protein